MTTPNLNPYTVARGRKGALDINQGGQIVAKLIKPGIHPYVLADLLNAAYQKGLANAPSDFTLIGQRAEHLDQRFKYVWWGTPIDRATVYVKTADLRPDSVHLAGFAALGKASLPQVDSPFAAITPDSGMTDELRAAITGQDHAHVLKLNAQRDRAEMGPDWAASQAAKLAPQPPQSAQPTYLISEREPRFTPNCWLWAKQGPLPGEGFWWHADDETYHADLESGDGEPATHWSPDAPNPPRSGPVDSVNPPKSAPQS